MKQMIFSDKDLGRLDARTMIFLRTKKLIRGSGCMLKSGHGEKRYIMTIFYEEKEK